VEEEKAKIIENEDSEYIKAVTTAKNKEVEADKAKQEYESKIKVVDKLKQSIAELEESSIQVVGSNLGNPSDTIEEGEAKEEGDGEAVDGKAEAGKVKDERVFSQ
jgi:hypothetical protein